MSPNGTMEAQYPAALPGRTLRRDNWWIEPLLTVLVLGGFSVYATWAALQNAFYFYYPYLSPFYSPCISENCQHTTVGLVGSWWNLSPAFLILWIPGGFRLTCYYYRKAYYRSFWWAPPACAVRDARTGYSGETAFPLILQNIHRYFFYLATIVVAFLWWDVILAFKFADGFGIGVGSIVLLVNATLLTLYSVSCHSCRHLCGGRLDVLSRAPARYSAWKLVSRLNERHMLFAWLSLFSVALADVYVRLLAMGTIHDYSFIIVRFS